MSNLLVKISFLLKTALLGVFWIKLVTECSNTDNVSFTVRQHFCLHVTIFFLIFHCKVTSFYTLWALFIYCCNIYTNALKITSEISFCYLHKTRLVQDSIIFNFLHLYTKVTIHLVLKFPPTLIHLWLISFSLYELKRTQKKLCCAMAYICGF
jgi:hypothetical protein